MRMQFYECLCLCAVIAGASGMLRSFVRGMGISAFSLIFVAAVTAAMGRFSAFPMPELRCNAAVVSLPCCFLLLAAGETDRRSTAVYVWRVLFAASVIPVIGTLGLSLYEWIVNRYASADLASVELRNAMAFFTAAAFLLLRLYLTAQQKKQLV